MLMVVAEKSKPQSKKPDRIRAVHSYTIGEEIANSVTHGIGITLSISALTLLVVFAAQTGNSWTLGASIICGLSLVLEYTASTLYHSFPWPKAKHAFKVLDHCFIYLLIAGTYTPYTLVTLRNASLGPISHIGLWLFAVVWTLAIAGISVEAAWTYRPKWTSAAIYLAIGWLIVIAIKPLVAGLAAPGLWLLVAGGLSYTVGTIFYVYKRVRYMHMIWHIFVLLGSVLSFLSVLIYVIIGS
jgi:hemolysin III